MKMEGIKILLIDRGRVKVGYLERHPELAFHWFLRGARVIRRWGTSEGLEQIAQDGPTEQTILDRPCDTTITFRSVIEILDCVEEKWLSHLSLKNNLPARQKKTSGVR